MGCSEIMRNIGGIIMDNKLVTFLSVALFAFVITVIALAVSNNNNASDLEECQARVSVLLSLTSTTLATTATEPVTTTTLAPITEPSQPPS